MEAAEQHLWGEARAAPGGTQLVPAGSCPPAPARAQPRPLGTMVVVPQGNRPKKGKMPDEAEEENKKEWETAL